MKYLENIVIASVVLLVYMVMAGAAPTVFGIVWLSALIALLVTVKDMIKAIVL